MTITKRAYRAVFTAAATAAMVGLSAGSALASTTLTVKVSGGGAYTATASKTVLTDGLVAVTCTTVGRKAASVGSGKLANGTHKGAAPVKIGTVAKLAFNNCRGPLGAVHTTVKATPYTVSADSKTTKKGQTDALISGVSVLVSSTACSFKVTGGTLGFYTNSKHTLTVTTKNKLPTKPVKTAQLTISGVSAGNCGGLVHNGDHPTYVSTYTLNKKTIISAK
jgi:hypothetical protein